MVAVSPFAAFKRKGNYLLAPFANTYERSGAYEFSQAPKSYI